MSDPPAHPEPRRRGRLRLLLSVAGAAVLAAAMAILPGAASAASGICSNQTGTNSGYYYQMWSNGQGSACITLGSGGNSYSTTWNGIGDFVAGVGWNPGSNETVTFNGGLSASGGTTLMSLYGWSTSPLVEYYVEEDYVGSPNTAGTYMGTVTSDGGTYDIYEHQQVNQPSIQGTATFEQYLAIRTSPTASGTITTQNFINAWASHGMNLGTLNYQILATESYGGGSGTSNATVSHSSSSGGGGGGGGGGGSSGCTATLSAGSSGSNWYNLNVAVTGSTSWTVTVDMASPAVVYSTTGVSASWPSEYVMVAKPGSGGNNWSFTVSPNGQWTWPSVSCSTG
ncbi:MAG: glycoside hydrolase family 11 protein [Trebonia sp.]